MINDDVQIWFCKNKNGDIMTIDEVDKSKEDTYYCPICGSLLIPRQGKINSWHFAHDDKSKCNNESIYHFWYKNKLLQSGDKFIVRADSDKEYICKEVLVEQTYQIGDKTYKPDLTVICETGEDIYFEFDYTNKKKLQDYINLWIELGNTVVEIDVKTLMNYRKDKLPMFKALWYDGKCFNVKKGEDEVYYDTIGKHKENVLRKVEFSKEKEELIKLDWLWSDIKKYKMGEIDIEHISDLIQSIEEEKSKDVIVSIFKRSTCSSCIIEDYIKFNDNRILKYLEDSKFKDMYYKLGVVTKIHTKIPRIIYDRLFDNGVYISLNIKDNGKNICNIKTYNIDRIKDFNTEYNMCRMIGNDLVNWFNNICKYNQYENIKYLQKPSITYQGDKTIILWNCSKISHCCIPLNKYKTKQEALDFILESTNIDKMFNTLEMNKLDNISFKLKTKYNSDIINLVSTIKRGCEFEVLIEDKDKNVLTPIYTFNKLKNDNLDYEVLYTHISNLIDNDNIFKIPKFLKVIDKINKKYKYEIFENTTICMKNLPNINYTCHINNYNFYLNNFGLNGCCYLRDYKTVEDFESFIKKNIDDKCIFTENDIYNIDCIYKDLIEEFGDYIGGEVTQLKYFKIWIKGNNGSSSDINALTLNKKEFDNIGCRNLYSYMSNIIQTKIEEFKVFNSIKLKIKELSNNGGFFDKIYERIKNIYEKFQDILVYKQNMDMNEHDRFYAYSIIIKGFEDNDILSFDFGINSIDFFKFKKWNGNNIKKKELKYDPYKLNNENIFNFINEIIEVEVLENAKLVEERLLENEKRILLGKEESNIRVNNIINKIINILNNNNKKISSYKVSYFTDSNYKNGIYFKDYRNKEFILHDSSQNNSKYRITKDDILIFKDYKNNNDMNFIDLKYINEDHEIYFIETVDSYDIDSNITLKYGIKNELKNNKINLSFKNINSSYIYLPRYNFINATKQLKDIQEEISNYKKEYKENLDHNGIHKQEVFFNDDINNKINKILYPIIYVNSKNNNTNLNIQLNIDFTKNSLNKLEPWIIKDFIEMLKSIGIKNITNII